MPAISDLVPALSSLVLVGALFAPSALDAEDDEVRVAVANIGQATLIVSAPSGGSPDVVTARKLRQKITCNFEDADFHVVMDWLHRQTGLNLIVDPNTEPAPVTLLVKEMTLGTALEWIAKQGGMKVSFLHEAVYLSDRIVRGERSTRLYDVSDLAKPIPHFRGPELAYNGDGGGAGGFGGGLFNEADDGDELDRPTVEDLAELIEEHLNNRR